MLENMPSSNVLLQAHEINRNGVISRARKSSIGAPPSSSLTRVVVLVGISRYLDIIRGNPASWRPNMLRRPVQLAGGGRMMFLISVSNSAIDEQRARSCVRRHLFFRPRRQRHVITAARRDILCVTHSSFTRNAVRPVDVRGSICRHRVPVSRPHGIVVRVAMTISMKHFCRGARPAPSRPARRGGVFVARVTALRLTRSMARAHEARLFARIIDAWAWGNS